MRREPDLQSAICQRITETLASAPIHDHLGYEALAYLKLPGPDYRHLLKALHQSLKPKLYVEIGVRRGDTLRLADPAVTRSIGIDPNPQLERAPVNSLVSVSTSDAFFASPQADRARAFDLAFIDGDHSFEQAARDFENLEKLAKPSSIICIHDVIPMDERTATPQAQTSFHTGDVWKLMAEIVLRRPDLVAFTVACPPTGLGIVGNFGAPPKRIERDLWPYVPPWIQLEGLINIVPNTGVAIAEAFNDARETAL